MKPPKALKSVLAAACVAGALGASLAYAAGPGPVNLQQIKTVFVIAMENHNFIQPSPTSSPEQIFTNPAAPFLNSLVTPGNPNAVQVSYCTEYYNTAVGVHPSEPNYVWNEAGSDFGFHSDADPAVPNGNVYTVPHFTAQLNAAGIPWKNYQENVSLAATPTNSASGTSGTVINPFYGTGQYNYAVKHNPMAFFTDTYNQNVYELNNLFTDLNNNTVGRYNWITPNQYNDAHSALSGGFAYHGAAFVGDQASIAQGDIFLATVIPQIMASAAYKDHGAIVIWFDETEGGDSTNYTLPEIIISPLAKGNAYASSLPYSHSSDIRTMEDIFGLNYVSNSIPVNETNAFGTYNYVANVNNLGDLFAPEPMPTADVATVEQISNVFVIAMENHDFTQPSSYTSIQPILGNTAAPYLNSLITPGNPNAAQVSYATHYYNTGVGVHPSEPNYVWNEAASDFGFDADSDPSPALGNVYTLPHFTGQLTESGIPWKNYQENLSLTPTPTNSASGTSGTVINPYYGTGQYNYAVKHNPMAFFTDTYNQNVYELNQLFTDLANNTVGRYNWITPNQYNDAHSALSGGFTYHGNHYTGDQAAVAQGDNFLATVVPQIMASAAYKNNGAIIIWWDESEGGDSTNYTLPYIVISPLCKGNAYASPLPYSHSSDLKTMDEIFKQSYVSNAIPVNHTNAFGGYNYVAQVNDLSDLFTPAGTFAGLNHIIVIYQENWSFDSQYGSFPGANGIANASSTALTQLDRVTGSPIFTLGAYDPEANTIPTQNPPVPLNGTQDLRFLTDTNNVNSPATVDTLLPYGLEGIIGFGPTSNPNDLTGDIVHRYWQEQFQIDHGNMDQFVTWSDNPGLVMSHVNATALPEGLLAKQYTLCDNYFHSAFGGSFLNHQFLVAAAAPVYPNAASLIPNNVALLDTNGVLQLDPTTHRQIRDGNITPIGGVVYSFPNQTFDQNYAVNTIQSQNLPSSGSPTAATYLPSQNDSNPSDPVRPYIPTIGDSLDAAGVSWKWYSGGWDRALNYTSINPAHYGVNGVDTNSPSISAYFQWHHQPLAFFDNYAPWTNGVRNARSAAHLQDENDFFADVSNSTLPAVCFIKPFGPDNEHPGYASVLQGQQHVASIVAAVQANPAIWGRTAIIVTYDEHGGHWDHVTPPARDIWGPGARVPAIIISPLAKTNYVDHTQYDTTTILSTIENRFGLPPLNSRDAAAPTFMNSFNLAAVSTPEPTNAPILAVAKHAGQVNLSWPSVYTSYVLQAETNSLSVGLSTNWVNVAGVSNNALSLPLDNTQPAIFFRLAKVAN